MNPKHPTKITPFQLVYGGEAVVPVEVGVESDWVKLYDKGNGERRLMELYLVDEVRDKEVVWLMAYRQRMRQNYSRRMIPRSFQVGDLVWKKINPVGDVTNSRHHGWDLTRSYRNSTRGAYYLEDENGKRLE
ncbi:uncharacterized protein LOC122023091 [Zingiber officinale]|uniref:uncharacterized protein LOC122023091 n=1 Tax=Zingiber officinale TaxID=94328 RepID=UPI001C4AE34F|nr:uncharacterized protein LOC122023091 [Zingiber officinale]